jgi:hypothetical protein
LFELIRDNWACIKTTSNNTDETQADAKITTTIQWNPEKIYSTITAQIQSAKGQCNSEGDQWLVINVKDSQGNPITGATVLAESINKDWSQTKQTNESGEARFLVKAGNTYSAKITKEGYSEETQANLYITQQEALTPHYVDVVLSPAQ